MRVINSSAMRIVVLAAMLCGTGAVVWGITLHGMAMLAPIWMPDMLLQAQWVLGLGGVVVGLGLLARRPAVSVAGLLTLAAAIFGIGTVATVALILLAALLLGWGVLHGLDRQSEPDPLIALPAGIAILVLVLPAFGIAGVDMRPVFWAILVGCLSILAAAPARTFIAGLVRGALSMPMPAAARWVPLWLTASWLIFALAHASLPERAWDVFAMHLLAPNQIVSFGQWSHPPSEMIFAVFPMGANYLFAFAMEFGGEPAVRLLNVVLLIGILALMRDILRDLCGAAMQDIGMTLLLSVPMALVLTASPFVENLLAFLVVATARTLLRGETTASRQAVAALVLLLPALAAVKLHGALLATVALPLGLWRLRRAHRSLLSWLPVLAMALVGGALGLAQYINAWVSTGNPVLPYLNNIFHSPLWPSAPFEDPRWGGKLTLDLLYEMTFRTQNFAEAFPGAIGFAPLALLLAGVLATLLFPQRAAWLCLALAAPPLAFLLIQIQYVRYFYFVLPLLVVVMVHGLAQVARLPFARLPVAALGLALACAGFVVLPSGSWMLVLGDLRGTYDPAIRQAVAAQMPVQLANEVVNAMATGRPRVIYGSIPYGANLRGWPIYTQWYNLPLMQALNGGGDAATVDAALGQVRADYVIAQIPPADPAEAKLTAYADRHGRIVGEAGVIGQIKVWRLDH